MDAASPELEPDGIPTEHHFWRTTTFENIMNYRIKNSCRFTAPENEATVTFIPMFLKMFGHRAQTFLPENLLRLSLPDIQKEHLTQFILHYQVPF